MAAAALFSIAGTVLKQLGSKVLQEAALLWGVGDDIKKLTRTLSSIQAVLLDAEEQSHSPKSHQLRLWLKELRQVVYDAEDLLDDFSVEVRRRQGTATASEKIWKEVLNFLSSSNQGAYRLKIAHGIQDIRSKLDEISERREMFHLEVRPVESMATKSRQQTHSDVPEMIVGREDDKNRVMEQLLRQSSHCKDNVSVVSIVGIGGLGKTTLAQLLYNDATVKSHFEVKAWACVSDNFNVKLIVEKIIESCTRRKPEKNLEMDTLRAQLYETVNEKRYLIVLDDVWSDDREKWSRLKGLLKGGAEGSRIVITTRLSKVAKLAATRGLEPYELKGLNESESWSLFREIAFEGGETTSGKHESIGREMLGKCKGVPLAIKTVAGALFFKETESEWVSFQSKGMWEMDQNESDIMPTLKLSYGHLPSHLKHCFAYCSLFPKDYDINVEKLIHLWIAQGFVQSSDPSNRFDVGLEYFKDLLWRSFFQEAEKDEHRDIIWCKMHDLMHDLAMSIAGEEISGALDDSRLTISRHVSLICPSNKKAHEILFSIVNNDDANKVRAVLCLYIYRSWDDHDLVPFIFSNMTRLRALDLNSLSILIVSPIIHKLKYLKYFDLSCNYMVEALPEEITELVNLEVLKLDGCIKLGQLPKGIGKLSCLFHLGVRGCVDLRHMPRGIGQLCYLRELSLFVIAATEIDSSETSSACVAGIGELRNLNNLRGCLRIKNLEEVKNPSDGELANLKGKQHLERLVLEWRRGSDFVDKEAEGKLLEALRPHPNLKKLTLKRNHGPQCPSWIPSMASLVELRIKGCGDWKRLRSLDQLPFLAKLKLQDMDSLEYIEYNWVSSSSSSFFPSLKSLSLERCPRLKGWLTPPAATEVGVVVLPQFPCVSNVNISACDSITSVPYFSPGLQTLVLEGGSKEFWKEILRMQPSSLPSPQSSCLVDLTIKRVRDLDTLPGEILSSSFSSLEKLTIRDCPELRTLSLHHLTSLKYLEIRACGKLDLLFDGDDDMMLQQQLLGGVILPLLSEVVLVNIPKLSRLPDWLQLAPELLEIRCWYCPIACMPGWMPKLVRLQRLEIFHYGKSASQYVNEDWPKIAHIPYIQINGVVIQKDGHPIPLEEVEEEEAAAAAEEEEAAAAAAAAAAAEEEEEEEEEEEAAAAENEVTEAVVGGVGGEEEEETEVTEAAGAEEAAAEEEVISNFLRRWFFPMNCNIFSRCFGA